jgi:hypothetical protein
LELLEAIVSQSPLPNHRVVAHFHAIRGNWNASPLRTRIAPQLIQEIARYPVFCLPSSAVQRLNAAAPEETAAAVRNGKAVMLTIANELKAYSAAFAALVDNVAAVANAV